MQRSRNTKTIREKNYMYYDIYLFEKQFRFENFLMRRRV